jgi:TPR repeat protein
VPQNHGEAARYLRLAADQGQAEARYNLALMYSTGDGVPQNSGEVARWLRLAADQGLDRAQNALARCYYEGEGLPRDHGEAARWLRLAADQGLAPAQVTLGRMLVGDIPVDERVPADLRAGAKLLARAAQCSDPNYDEFRVDALEHLREYADKREVVWACCIGCGATHGLKRCVKCHAARFCGSACMRQMWPAHKQCCARWAEQRDDAPK